MTVRLSALRAGHTLPPGRFLVLISVRGWVEPRATVRLEGLGHLKNPLPSSRIEPAKLSTQLFCFPVDWFTDFVIPQNKPFQLSWIHWWMCFLTLNTRYSWWTLRTLINSNILQASFPLVRPVISFPLAHKLVVALDCHSSVNVTSFHMLWHENEVRKSLFFWLVVSTTTIDASQCYYYSEETNINCEVSDRLYRPFTCNYSGTR
jgi:hypothetical protein